MKISYHKGTDSLYIHLSDALTADSEEVAEDTVLHFDEDGNVTGMEIYGGASGKVDLSMVDIVDLERRAPTVRALGSSPHGWVWQAKADKQPATSSWASSVNLGVRISGTAIRSRAFERYKSAVDKNSICELTNNKNLDRRAV